MRKTKLPNLFLIGAPKCGTTTLVNWLSSTKQVFVPLGREPHYFADDIFPDRVCNSMNRYKELYIKSPQDIKYLLDGSTGYLSSAVSVPSILSISPESKFIILVRDPSEMMISLHRERVSEGREKKISAREAWNQSNISDLDPALNYKLQCKLASQIKNIQQIIHEPNLLILSLKEIAEDPENSFDHLINFLDLPNVSYPSFEIHGKAITRKSNAFQSIIFSLKKLRQKLNIPSIGFGFFKFLERMNTINKKAKLTDPDLVNDLRNELKDERNELLKILKNRKRYVLNDPL
jgi:hypothetical protein